jgi:hypothetical protein
VNGPIPVWEARMTKLAIALLVLGAVFLFVDHQHRLLAADIYCQIGAGELRQTRSPARNAGASNQSWTGNQYCLHGSVWDAIMGRHNNWYQDSNP